MRAGTRVLLVARDTDGGLVGTAQLDLPGKPNARYRAEAMKTIGCSIDGSSERRRPFDGRGEPMREVRA